MKKNANIQPALRVALLFLAFAVLLFWLEGFCEAAQHDDAVYADVLSRYGSLYAFLSERVETWSSRLFGDAFSVLLAPQPVLWRICNALIGAGLFVCAGLVCAEKQSAALFSVLAFLLSFLLMIPPHILSGAGWITTTVNYLWPFAFGLFALLPLSRLFRKERCSAALHVFAAISLLIAANTEQFAVMLLLFYAAAGFYLLSQKNLPPWFFLHIAILCLSLLFILLVPGNRVRIARETLSHMPYFAELSVGEKLFSGLLTLLHALFGGAEQYAYVTLVLLLSYALLAVKRRRPRRVIVFLFIAPLLLSAEQLLYFLWRNGSWNSGLRFLGALWQNYELPGYGGTEGAPLLFQLCFSLLLLLLTLAAPLLVYGRSFLSAVHLTVLCAGLLSVLMLGFSPTIYASAGRILFPCIGAFLLLSAGCLTALFRGRAA